MKFINKVKRIVSRIIFRTPKAVPKTVEDESQKTHPKYSTWKYVIPFPPPGLMGTSGAPSVENFLVVGDAWGQVISKFVKKNAILLDIGCGCGKTARILVNNFNIKKYIGFDVIKECIEWNKHYICPLDNRFDFFHFDLHSNEYNPTGKLKACDFKFPVETSSIDLVFAASLFTHLLEQDTINYLKETRRVLKKHGIAILSIHIEPKQGENYSGTESRIDIEPKYFIKLAKDVSLILHEEIGELCGQETFVFKAE